MPRWLRKKFVATATVFALLVILFISVGHLRGRRQKRREYGLGEALDAIQAKDDRYVVYNRVPKCGSMSMTTLGYRLGGANGFKVASPYEDGEKPGKSKEEESEFVYSLEKQPPGFMYIRHQYFIDFTELSHKQPLYINMIRDPIARFQSFYYFSRFGNNRGGGASARMSDERRFETIDECIQKRRQECIKPYWQVVPYFCGQEHGCMSRSQWAVDKAKQNIKDHYAFVGTLENLDGSLEILETLLPRYFKDARNVYRNPENERMKHETSTRKKQEPSEAAKEFLRTETCLKLEYDLYRFVQTRLNGIRTSLQ